MRAVMYHYVRQPVKSQPNLKFLHVDDFIRQLDYFSKVGHLLSKEDFFEVLEKKEPIPNSYLLTFDDGLKDHYEFVVPELVARNLLGLFFVSSQPLAEKKMLDVHRIHLLLARYGGKMMLEKLNKIVDIHQMKFADRAAFRQNTYRIHDCDESTLLFKKALNFFSAESQRSEILQKLMKEMLCEEELFLRHYMTELEIKEIASAGMIVGNHTHGHEVLSKLSPASQKKSIETCDSLLMGYFPDMVKLFCYPHGGAHTFNDETKKILKRINIKFAFSVDPKPITALDLRDRPFSLPRYDCRFYQETIMSA